MADELNFLDLVALSNITPGLVVEKFGGKINSSFFDGSNILGTLRIKGLVDFTANFPGQSIISLTESGKSIIAEAEERAKAPFDAVDFAIVAQLQGGKRSYVDVGGAVNLRPRDLAMHLYRMGKQQYIVYDIKNGSIDIMLTEKGLLQAKAGFQQPQAQPVTSGQAQQMATPSTGTQQNQPAVSQMLPKSNETNNVQEGQALADIENKISSSKKRRKANLIVVIGIIIIIVILLLLARVI
jgi:hypothetical protein